MCYFPIQFGCYLPQQKIQVESNSSYNPRPHREFVHLLRMQMKCKKKIEVRIKGNIKPQGCLKKSGQGYHYYNIFDSKILKK